MQVVGLHIYPLKSGRGVALSSSLLGPEGLPGDRRLMLTDPSGHFITQRDLPGIAGITAKVSAEEITLSLDDGRQVTSAFPSPERRQPVAVWKSIVDSALAEDEQNQTLSGWLGREVRLVAFDERSSREASAEWDGGGTPVTFADGFQILVTTTGSLAALNAEMAAHGEGTVGMDRFRPNIVIDCEDPWVEDQWAAIRIGDIRLDLVKPCARCIMTTQDQRTGSRDVESPMPAMGRVRMSADRRVPGPLFGWNAVPRGDGKISIGDRVDVIETRAEGWPLKRR